MVDNLLLAGIIITVAGILSTTICTYLAKQRKAAGKDLGPVALALALSVILIVAGIALSVVPFVTGSKPARQFW